MKRDHITFIVGFVMLGAVGLLFFLQIALFRNPPLSGLPNRTANIAALTTVPINNLPPTRPITAAVSLTAAPTITSTGIITSAVLTGRGNAMLLREAPLPIANVKIQNFRYIAPSLTVPVGSTVKWTQFDKEPHTVSAGTPKNRDRYSAFNSGTLTTVGVTTYEFTFQTPGIYPYFCVYHPQMLGEIVVENPGNTAPTPTPRKPTAAATTTPRPATTKPTATAAATRRPATAAPVFAAPPPGARIVAAGLINPRGFTKGPDGALYIAEAGTVPVVATLVAPTHAPTVVTTLVVRTTAPTAAATLVVPATPLNVHPSPQPSGTPSPICSGQLPGYDKPAANCPDAPGPQISKNGRISRIAPNGTRTTVVANLPATVGPFNDVFGVNSVAFVGDDLYVIIAAGATRGHPDFPTGVYRVANAKTTLVADLEEFQKQHPPKFISDDDNSSLPYDVVALNGKLYVTDGNAAAVFEIDPSQPPGKNVKRIVDLSATHNVLTGISTGADGAIYFNGLNPASYPVGGAQIFKWTPQGGLKTVTAGLGIATGLAVAPDGSIYAAEFATDLAKPLSIVPPGRVVKIGANGRVETVAAPLVYPTALRWLDGSLYVTNNGVNAVEGEQPNGEILRLEAP